MEYLFLILFCYAVKSETVGKKYFVVNKPQDNIQQQDVKEFKKPFQVYWNVPTMQCTSKRIPFQNLYEKFGIIQNDNDRFIGNKIVVIYNEIDFPAIIKTKSGKNLLRNGGVPQEGNLENHLIAFENNLNDKIPDPYFDGIAIIDFESWRPVFRQNFGSLVPHKTLSIEIEKRLHNWWPKMWIGREASLRFEAAARRFMSTTLSMSKELRPNALWGYYGFPYCFNMKGRDMVEKCAANIDKENDSIYWLWAESTALFPSIYSSVSLSSSQLTSLIKGRVKEALRVRGVDIPIFPYVWYRYRDAGFITEKDLDVAFATLYQSNASGLIIWGSSNDVNTVEKCNKLFMYVETVLGPKIAKYTKPLKKIHSDHLEKKEVYTKETPIVIDGLSYIQSTQSLNTDKLFSIETLNEYNKFTKTDESSQTLYNDEKSSTETTIKDNEYTNTDNSKILHNFDLTSSLLESSTIHNEYINAFQRKLTLNNDEISSTETAIAYNEHTNNDKNSQSLKSDDNFSSEISKAYSKFTNTVETTQTLNNYDISLVENSTTYNTDERSQTSNIDISHVYNDYSDAEKNVEPLISADLISLSESSSIDSSLENIYRDRLSQTSNLSNGKSTIAYKKYSENQENVQTLNYNDVVSSSDSSTIYEENRDYITTTLHNDEMSFSRVSTIDNIYRDESSQTSYNQMSNEETTIAYNEFSKTEDNLHTLNNGNVLSSTVSSTTSDEKRDHNTFFFNNDEISLTTRDTIYSKYLNTDNEIPSKGTSMIYDFNEDQNTESLHNIKNFKETLPPSVEISYTDKGILIDGEIITEENKLESTEDYFLNNKKLPNSSEDRFDYLIRADNSANIEENLKNIEYENSINVEDDYLIIVRDQKNIPNSRENITNSKLETVYYTTQADDNHETVTRSEHFSENSNDLDLVVTYIDKKDDIERNEELTTKIESFHSIKLSNSDDDDDDRSDYLIIVDNSTNIDTYNQLENTNITNDDNDYLIIVPDFINEKSEKDSILDNNLDLDSQTKADLEAGTQFEDFGVPSEDLDPVVAYINKIIDNQEWISTEDESLNNIKLRNSDEDTTDYLIKFVTNKKIDNQYVYTESTIADDDYIIIVKNLDDSE